MDIENESIVVEKLNSELSGLLKHWKDENVVNTQNEKKTPKGERTYEAHEEMFNFMLNEFDDQVYSLEMVVDEPTDEMVKEQLEGMVNWDTSDVRGKIKKTETDGFIQYKIMVEGNANRNDKQITRNLGGYPYVRFWAKRSAVNVESMHRLQAYLLPEEIVSMKFVKKDK